MGTPRDDLALPSCAVQVALDFEGNKEWGQNRGPMVQLFADLVGLEEGIPWCAAFVYGCLDIACALKNDRYNPLQEVRHKALVQSVYDYAEASGWVVPASESTVGDLVLFDFGRTDRDWEHIGFVRRPARGGTDFTSIEGNIGAGSDREGKYVSVRDRVVGPDVCFVRYV